MAIQVKVPAVGESVQEGMIESWRKASGDFVERDEIVLDLETDKATVEVPAPGAGQITILVEKGQVVKVGQVIATIDETKSQGASPSKASAKAPEVVAQPSKTADLDPGPAVGRMVREQGLDLKDYEGTGKGGRVTKEDVLSQTKNEPKSAAQPAASKAAPIAMPVVSSEGRSQSSRPMSMIRRRIAERLLDVQKNAAILTTFNEVDMTNVMDLRNKYKDHFQKKYNLKLGFMGFFLKASALALEEYPNVNSYIQGTDILSHNYCDIGVAVSTEKGLMVPVLRDVQKMSLPQIEQAIAAYSAKARDNRITLDDLSGGTFTVSNGGVFGSLMSTPILNPPQSAILGMHKTQMRPIVMEDGSIKARPMMYLALSYDHRIIDGKEGVGFLVKIKEGIEDPARLILGV